MTPLERNLPSVIAALSDGLDVSDFHRRFRIRDGVTLICTLNLQEPPPRRRLLNNYVMAIFTRLIYARHRLDVPVRSYAIAVREYAMSQLDIDEFGFPHAKVVAGADHKDVEAETMAMITNQFMADYQTGN
jgi:hypothetical protein